MPDNATNKALTWSSSNTSIATVNSSGTVAGVGAGTATITVRSQADTTKSASCTVTVSAAAPTTLAAYLAWLQTNAQSNTQYSYTKLHILGIMYRMSIEKGGWDASASINTRKSVRRVGELQKEQKFEFRVEAVFVCMATL
jgi:hypothetical protein